VEAEKQRAAMKLLSETAFSTPKYEPGLLNHLAATRWTHWGMRPYSRLDFAIHEAVERMQAGILLQLLDPTTLSRLHDGELKVAADGEAYTLAEHLRTIIDGIFTEWQTPKPGEYTNQKPYLSSFRRNLQRMTLKYLAKLVTDGYGAPEDARTLSRMHLATMDQQITAVLENKEVKLDDYSRAHLLDCQSRIRQVLNAALEVRSVN
jgi:hypothetical protein